MILEAIRSIRSDRPSLRKFGIVIGTALAVLGALFYWKQSAYYQFLAVVSAVFIVTGLAAPTILTPIHKIWMTLAIVVGWLVTQLILIVLFYVVLTSIGAIGRLFGKQFLHLEFDKAAGSYWIPKHLSETTQADHERQF